MQAFPRDLTSSFLQLSARYPSRYRDMASLYGDFSPVQGFVLGKGWLQL